MANNHNVYLALWSGSRPHLVFAAGSSPVTHDHESVLALVRHDRLQMQILELIDKVWSVISISHLVSNSSEDGFSIVGAVRHGALYRHARWKFATLEIFKH